MPRAIDDNPKKWGYRSPGARMEIVGIDALKTAKVDCLLLLAWNFEKEIRGRCRAAGHEGAGFWFPFLGGAPRRGRRGIMKTPIQDLRLPPGRLGFIGAHFTRLALGAAVGACGAST